MSPPHSRVVPSCSLTLDSCRFSTLVLTLLSVLLLSLPLPTVTWFTIPASSSPPLSRRGHSASIWQQQLIVIFGGRHVTLKQQQECCTTYPSSHIPIGHADPDCNLLIDCAYHGYCILSNSTVPLSALPSSELLNPSVLNPYTNSVDDLDCQCIDGWSGDMCHIQQIDAYMSDVYYYNVTSNSFLQRYTLDTSGFTASQNHWPEARYFHSSVILNDTLLIYGGYSQICEDYCSALWEWPLSLAHGSNWTQATTDLLTNTIVPPRRWKHSAVVYDGAMFVFGGHNSDGYLNDLWKYERFSNDNGITWQRRWVNLTSYGPQPAGRSAHASEIYLNQWYIFGGYRAPSVRDANSRYAGSAFYLDDMWALDLDHFVWRKVVQPADAAESPPAFMGSKMVMAEDAQYHHHVLLLFGGEINSEFSSSIWRFNISTGYWTRHLDRLFVDALPPARSDHTWLYFPHLEKLWLFGGWNHGVYTASNSSTVMHTSSAAAKRGRPTHTLITKTVQTFAMPQQQQKSNEKHHAHITSSRTITVYNIDNGGVVEYYKNDMWFFDLNSCKDGCNGRGQCVFGYCFCEEQYYGDNCQDAKCTSSLCSYLVSSQQQSCEHCSHNQGACFLGGCICKSGYDGDDCTNSYCPNDCSGHGSCELKKTSTGRSYSCVCQSPWLGPDCSVKPCATNCNFPNGHCNTNTGTCVCHSNVLGPFVGEACGFQQVLV